VVVAARDGAEVAKYGTAINELTLRLSKEDQPILDVLQAMFTLTQAAPSAGKSDAVAKAMQILTLWARGDIAVESILTEVRFSARLEVGDRIRILPKTTP
jgi:hypothetical protein